MARTNRKKPPQAKSLEESLATTMTPAQSDVREVERYFANVQPVNNYRDILKNMSMMRFAVLHGMVNSKVANTYTYMMSFEMMALAKLHVDSGELDELKEKIDQNGGVVDLTQEQAAQLTQEPNMLAQARLLVKFIDANKGKVPAPAPAEDVVDVESIIKITETKIQESEGFI